MSAAAVEALADQALAGTDGYAIGQGLIVISDLLLLERVSQGAEVPETLRLERGDGRCAYVFREPVTPSCCTRQVSDRRCPCGIAVAIVCDGCEQILSLLIAPGAEPCEHVMALELTS